MFEIVKQIFYFNPDIINVFQLSLIKTTEPVATAGTSFILPRGGRYHPYHTLNTELYFAGESYTHLCLAILQ